MPRTIRSRALAFVAWALAIPVAASPVEPAAGRAAQPGRTAEVEPLAGPSIERFALYAPAQGHERGAPEVLGLVEWRRRRIPRGLQLQREVRFVDAGRHAGRVVHVERLTDRDARLVWREIGTASGRSLSAQWTRDARGLLVFEWGRDGARRVTLEAWKGVALPLYLIELARSGRATQGRYATFDPLGRRLETVVLRTSYAIARAPAATTWDGAEPSAPTEAGAPLEPGPESATRTVELVRRDGTLAGRYVFRGTELVAFQLQDGGPIARAVSGATYSRILDGLEEAARAPR